MESNVENKSNVESKCKDVLCFFKGDGAKVVQEADGKKKEVDLSLLKDEDKLNVKFTDELRNINCNGIVSAKDLRDSEFLDEIVMKYGSQQDKEELSNPKGTAKAFFISATYGDGHTTIYNRLPTTKGITLENISQHIGDEVKDMKEYEGQIVDVLYISKDELNELHRYIGTLNNEGKRQGRGMYSYGDGEYYVGEWKNNEKAGKGMYSYGNGEYYVGDWKNGERNGYRKMIYKSGKIEKGELENDRLKVQGKDIAKDFTYRGKEYKNVLCFLKGDGTKVVREANGEKKEVNLSLLKGEDKLNVKFTDELRNINWEGVVSVKDLKKTMFLDEIVMNMKYGTEEERKKLINPPKVDAFLILVDDGKGSFKIYTSKEGAKIDNVDGKNYSKYLWTEVTDNSEYNEYKDKVVNIVLVKQGEPGLRQRYIGTVNEESESKRRGVIYHENGDCYAGNWKLMKPQFLISVVDDKNDFKIYTSKERAEIDNVDGKNYGKYLGGEVKDKSKYKGKIVDIVLVKQGEPEVRQRYIGTVNEKFERQGRGVIYHEDGDYYAGYWKNNKRDGKGIHYDNENRNYYAGNWKEGKKNGYGKKIYENGNIYEGMWENDKQNGKGKLIFKSGAIYKGDFKDGIIAGYGEIKYADGAIYKGEFENGIPKNGVGVEITNNGEYFQGQFVSVRDTEGKYIGMKRSGEGVGQRGNVTIISKNWNGGNIEGQFLRITDGKKVVEICEKSAGVNFVKVVSKIPLNENIVWDRANEDYKEFSDRVYQIVNTKEHELHNINSDSDDDNIRFTTIITHERRTNRNVKPQYSEKGGKGKSRGVAV